MSDSLTYSEIFQRYISSREICSYDQGEREREKECEGDAVLTPLAFRFRSQPFDPTEFRDKRSFYSPVYSFTYPFLCLYFIFRDRSNLRPDSEPMLAPPRGLFPGSLRLWTDIRWEIESCLSGSLNIKFRVKGIFRETKYSRGNEWPRSVWSWRIGWTVVSSSHS